MWTKNGKNYTGVLEYNNKRIWGASPEMLKEAGYEWIEPVPVPVAKKYSTLKIIRALGSEWETYRQQLSDAKIIDQFFAANYLASDDPVFMAFMEKVPDELKAKLDDCIWEN